MPGSAGLGPSLGPSCPQFFLGFTAMGGRSDRPATSLPAGLVGCICHMPASCFMLAVGKRSPQPPGSTLLLEEGHEAQWKPEGPKGRTRSGRSVSLNSLIAVVRRPCAPSASVALPPLLHAPSPLSQVKRHFEVKRLCAVT
jgi:hypothetical protein